MPRDLSTQALDCQWLLQNASWLAGKAPPFRAGFSARAPWWCAVIHAGQPKALSPIDMNDSLLNELAARLAEMAAANPAKDLEKNARGLLAAAFARLDLVTREEFDVQSEVLRRAREQVKELESRVAQLEQRLSQGKR